MAAPIGAALSALMSATRGAVTAGRAAGSLGRTVVSQNFNAAIAGGDYPHTRELHYQANLRVSNLVPDLQSITRVWLADKLSDAQYRQLLGYHGARWNSGQVGGGGGIVQRAWNAIAEMSATRGTPEDYLHWLRQDRIELGELTDLLKLEGYKNEKDRQLFIGQYNSLEMSSVIGMYFVGRLTKNEAIARLIEIGFRNEEASLLLDDVWYGLSLPDLITLHNRGKIDEGEYLQQMAAIGIRDSVSLGYAEEFGRAYPTISDLVQFSVREVWKPDIIARYGYDDEFPEEFRYWAAKQGLDWGEGFDPGDGQQRPELTWPKAYWRSHWQLMSPTQSYTALHRARGEPDNPATWRIPGVRPFVRDDMDKMLAVNDYAPGVRDWLTAISYNVLRLVDIRKMTKLGLKDKAWAIEQYMDRGHTRPDAVAIADLGQKEKEQYENPLHTKWKRTHSQKTFDRLRKGFKAGFVGRPIFIRKLQDAGFTPEEAESEAEAVEFELQVETVDKVRVAVRRDFMIGLSDATTTQARLVAIGISVYHADNYLIRWRAERGEVRKQASTKQILEWLTDGQINAEESRRRLENLGWSNTDAMLYLFAARRKMLETQIKEATVVEKKKVQAAKGMERLIREQEAQVRMSQARMRAITPISTLKSWLRKDRISEAAFRNYALSSGILPDIVNRYVIEAMYERAQANNGDGSGITEEGREAEGQ